MPTLRVDPADPSPEALDRAAAVLRDGGLVAFPTETVYGLGADALDADAVRRIFQAKRRPAHNPLIVHVADAAGAQEMVRDWPETAERAATAFWPGPLTLVLRKRPAVPDRVTAGLPTVAIRVPAHPVALALLRTAELPVAAPSANPFTGVSPTTAGHVERALGDRVDLILDGGPTTVGIESTVVDLSGERPVLLRPGMISRHELERVIGTVDVRRRRPAEGSPRPSPGMTPRHYSPEADLRLFRASERARADALARQAAARGQVVGALVRTPLGSPVAHTRRMPAEPEAYARELYAALHALDAAGCDMVLVEQVPDSPEWDGIRDRLERAAEAL